MSVWYSHIEIIKKHMTRRCCTLVLLLIVFNSSAQVHVSHQLNVLRTNKHESADIEFCFQNTDTAAYALYLNVWRILMARDQNETISGVPYTTNMVNFVFITPPRYNFKPFFDSQTEFQLIESSLYSCRIKKLLPNDKFRIHLVVTDSTILSFLNKKSFQISYIYSICKFSRLDSLLGHSFNQFYSYDNLVLPDNGMLSNDAVFIYPENCVVRRDVMWELNELFEKREYNIDF